MARAMRIALFVLGGFVTLLIAAAVAILLFVDPNEYRDDIGKAVKEATGRELIIGAIDLSLFPWLGVQLQQVELGNAPGFDGSFARMEGVDVRVMLLPLLRREIEVSTVILNGLALNLGRNAQGVSNWEDLVKPAPQAGEAVAEKKAGPDKPAIATLAIGGVEIVNSRVVWDDRQAGVRQEISDFNLRSGAISLDSPFDLSASLNAQSSAPALKAQVALQSQVHPDLAQQQLQLKGLVLDVTAESRELIPVGVTKIRLAGDVVADLARQHYQVKGLALDVNADGKGDLPLGPLKAHLTAEIMADVAQEQYQVKGMTLDVKAESKEYLPAGPADVKLSAEMTANLARQNLHVSRLQVTGLGVQLDGEAHGEYILKDIALNGTLRSNTFSARDLLERLGIKLETADPKALAQTSVELGFKAGTSRAALEGLKVRLDDTTLSGSASVTDFARPAIRFALDMDALDADRYLLPPAPEAPATAPAAVAAPAAPLALPLETLRSLDVDGRFSAGRLKISNVRLADMSVSLKARDGVVAMTPIKARLYDGSFQGAVQLDARKDVPVFKVSEKLDGVNIHPLLKDLLDLGMMEGTADIEAEVTTQGLTVEALKSALNGSGKFALNDGAVNGINIVYELEKAYALIKGRSEPPPRAANKTDFAEFKGGFTIVNGVVDNQSLAASAPLLRVRGKGTADLNAERLDYRTDVTVVASLEGQGGKGLEDLRGLTIPLRIHGPFAEPKVRVELDKVLKARAEEAIDRKKKEVEERVEKKVEEKREELKQEAEEKAKEKLKKLLKF